MSDFEGVKRRKFVRLRRKFVRLYTLYIARATSIYTSYALHTRMNFRYEMSSQKSRERKKARGKNTEPLGSGESIFLAMYIFLYIGLLYICIIAIFA